MTEPTNPQPARAALRDRIAALFRTPPGVERLGDATPGEIADAVLAVIPETADRGAIQAAALRDAANRFATLADQNEAYDAEQGTLDLESRLQHEAVRDVAVGLRRMADEAQQPETEAVADCNAGPGWYEVINPRNATTRIALVYEDGSLYLPEGLDALTPDEFAFAAARGNAHRLVRADEQPAAVSQPGKEG